MSNPRHRIRPFRFTTSMPALTGPASRWRDDVRRIEELGFDPVSVSDHLTGGWSMDPVVAMTVAAEATSRLRVLALVFCNDWRWRPPGAGARRPVRGHHRDQPPPRGRREFPRRRGTKRRSGEPTRRHRP